MEANHHLSNKFALFYNMSKYYKSIGYDPFEVLPLTFHVIGGSEDPEFLKFQQFFKAEADKLGIVDLTHSPENQVILKQHKASEPAPTP